MLAFIISLCYSPRKPEKIEPTTMEVTKKFNLSNCGYLGCINEVSDETTKRIAKIGRKQYKFCSQYCYDEWLQTPALSF